MAVEPECLAHAGDCRAAAAAAEGDESIGVVAEAGVGADLGEASGVGRGQPQGAPAVAHGRPRDTGRAGDLGVGVDAELAHKVRPSGRDEEGSPSRDDGLPGAAERRGEEIVPHATEPK